MVQQRRVAVVADSSSCLPKSLDGELDLHIVPHELVIEGRSYRDGVDIDPSQFYSIQSNNHQVCTTSAPTPTAFLEAFKQAGTKAEAILCLTLSSNFSATYESAQAAVRTAQHELPHLQIKVIDSQAAAGAEGLIALEAARQAKMDASLETVCHKVEELIPRVNLLAFVHTLYYLGKSGRIPKIAAWAGSLLGIKPLTEMTLGEARLLEKPRTRVKATDRMVEIMKGRVGESPVCINIMHAHAADDAEELRLRIDRDFNCREIFVSEFTPVMGAHTGPGLLGVAFYTEIPAASEGTP